MLAVTRVSFAGPMRQSPWLLALLTITFGLGAHVLGGGASVGCAPLLLAAALGVGTTLSAQQVAGQVYRGAPVAVLMLGIGQFGMHLALSGHEDIDSSFGLSCGLVVAHIVATALLAILLLGAHQSVELALHLLARARGRVRVFITLAAPLATDPTKRTSVFSRVRDRQSRHGEQWRVGLTRPRRGPPIHA